MMSEHTYPHLFSQGSIGKLHLKNRIIMSPTETLYASACGEVTPEIIGYYRRRAAGGVGMIVLHSVQGNSCVDPLDPYAGSLRLDNNAYIPRMSDLTEAVHAKGAKIAALVSIGGGACGAGERYIERDPQTSRRVGPSDLAAGNGREATRMLSVEEIQRTIEEYGRCALRARAAGFDAFCIHALGSYLLAEFLSPLFNHRTDGYGGCAENRWRLLFELIAQCKRCAGEDFPLIVRISVDEMHPEGRTFAESLQFLKLVEKAGIAALDLTAGLMEPMRRTIPSIYVPHDVNRDYYVRCKQELSVPIICSGKQCDPDIAERTLADACGDFISIGRGLIAEPDWPNKVAAGRAEEIRRCLSCNYCIGQRIMRHLPLRCAFNPYAGREASDDEHIASTRNPKRIAIIGGGAAGLEAARVLGLRGHTVDIYEAADALCGGQLRLAAVPPCKGSISHIERYYVSQLAHLPNVRVHLNAVIDAEQSKRLRADLFLVATGAEALVPGISGVPGEDVYTAQEALAGVCPIGERVLILGGGQIGAETAHHLVCKGKKVTIVEMLPDIAAQEEPLTRAALLNLLCEAKVELITECKVEALLTHMARLCSLSSGEQLLIPFDTALLALGTHSVNELYHTLVMANGENRVMLIGDASSVGTIASAISQAYAVAMEI